MERSWDLWFLSLESAEVCRLQPYQPVHIFWAQYSAVKTHTPMLLKIPQEVKYFFEITQVFYLLKNNLKWWYSGNTKKSKATVNTWLWIPKALAAPLPSVLYNFSLWYPCDRDLWPLPPWQAPVHLLISTNPHLFILILAQKLFLPSPKKIPKAFLAISTQNWWHSTPSICYDHNQGSYNQQRGCLWDAGPHLAMNSLCSCSQQQRAGWIAPNPQSRADIYGQC